MHIKPDYDFNTMSTYTLSLFEDKTKAAIVSASDRAFDKVTELRKAADEQMHIVHLWDRLHEELVKHKVEKVSQLPPDRIKYWKSALDYPLRMQANL